MRVLIADDHDLVLEGLKVILHGLGSEIAIVACGNFADALESAAQADGFDLVVLDLDMPGMNGVMGVEVFRSYFPEPPLVVLADGTQGEDVLKALRFGAAGFVPKSLRAEAMVHAFRLVLSGERFIPADLLSAGLPEPNAADGGGAVTPLQRLTAREAEVLEKLLDGLTNKEIGRGLDIQEVTVKLHLRSVYRKLGVKNRAQAVKVALGFGQRHYTNRR